MDYIRQHGLDGLKKHLRGDGLRIRADGMPDRRTVVGKALDRYEDELETLRDAKRIERMRSRQSQNNSSF